MCRIDLLRSVLGLIRFCKISAYGLELESSMFEYSKVDFRVQTRVVGTRCFRESMHMLSLVAGEPLCAKSGRTALCCVLTVLEAL